jgi:hypothetical protein
MKVYLKFNCILSGKYVITILVIVIAISFTTSKVHERKLVVSCKRELSEAKEGNLWYLVKGGF